LLLKIDMHVHTWYSDSNGSVEEVLKVARQRNLDGIAITDHDTLRGAYEALEKKGDLIVIPGEEVKTKRGEILALGIMKTIPRYLAITEAINMVHVQGGFVALPHPTLPFFNKLKEEDMKQLPIDGLEVFSAITPFSGHYLEKNINLARRLGVTEIAGSDSHFFETVGDAYTIVYSKSRDLKDVLTALKMGHTSIEGSPSKLALKLRMFKTVFTHISRKPFLFG